MKKIDQIVSKMIRDFGSVSGTIISKDLVSAYVKLYGIDQEFRVTASYKVVDKNIHLYNFQCFDSDAINYFLKLHGGEVVCEIPWKVRMVLWLVSRSKV